MKTDPLTEKGIPEAAMLDVILPRAKSAREGIELLAKVIEEKGSAEGNTVVIADQKETWYMEILSGHQYVAVKSQKTNMQSLQIPTTLVMWI